MGIFHGKASDIVNRKELLNYLMPVGYIYISTTNVSPEQFLGGKWKAISQGRCLMGAGVVEANNDNWCGTTSAGDWTADAGKMGGETYHKLTNDEMPSHDHTVIINVQHSDGVVVGDDVEALTSGIQRTGKRRYQDTTEPAGSSYAHNNMPPYLVVYMWERIE